MKLYDYKSAPNPRRVRIFLAEKGVEVELVHTDMLKQAHKIPEFLVKNPSGKIPVLELDDGRYLPESVAICRYIEAIHPEPNLFGKDPFELGFIESRNRQIELEYWTQLGISWRNGPVLAQMGMSNQIPDAKEQSDQAVNAYYTRLNDEFSESNYVAGERYTVADITLLTGIDFATSLVGLKPDEALTNLWRWHKLVTDRPSSQA